MSDKERDIHLRIGLDGAELMPGDPGYDNIAPTAAQVEHYTEQGMDPKELRERHRAEAKAEETLRKTNAQTTDAGDKK